MMRSVSWYLILLLLIPGLFSCSSARKAKSTVAPTGSIPVYAQEYLKRYSDLAVSEMKRTGIPASITLAQGMLESDYGRSTLARKGNNHFGIKCHSDWRGERIYHDDNRKGECFRAYPSADDSYRDHSDFLVSGSRYRDLFKLSPTDYKGWAHGLKKAGYATDPSYPELLIRKIDEYGLHAYDIGSNKTAKSASVKPAEPTQTSSPPQSQPQSQPQTQPQPQPQSQPLTEAPGKVVTLSPGRIAVNNGVQFTIVREGETIASLAEEFQLLEWEISRHNDLQQGASLQPGQVVYLEPKKNKAGEGFGVHIVAPGDTMHSVSQKYAIRLSSLYKMNMMDEGSECVPGQRLRLR